jgi:hypothetical protein
MRSFLVKWVLGINSNGGAITTWQRGYRLQVFGSSTRILQAELMDKITIKEEQLLTK